MRTEVSSTQSTELNSNDSLVYRLLTLSHYPPLLSARDRRTDSHIYQRLRNELGSGQDALKALSNSPTFLATWRGQPSHINRTPTGNRLSYLLTVAELNRTDLRHISPTQESTDYGRDCINRIQLLTRLVLDLRTDQRLTSQDFADFFQPLQELDPELYQTITEGIGLFFRNDYLPAAYILTLQIEDLIRLLVQRNGTSTQEKTQRGLTEKPLGRLLPHLKPLLPTDVFHYANWVLKDYRGLNLRNAIAHGFLKKSNTRPTVVVALIYLICLLRLNLLRAPRGID